MATDQTLRLNVLLPLIMPFAGGCTEAFALFQSRLAAIEFCERSKCWRYISTVQITENNAAIIAPDTATIHEFESVTFDGNPLTPTQFTDADPDELTGATSSGEPKWITQSSPGEIAIYPFKAGTLRISCFLKPRHGQQFGTDPTDPMHDAFNVIPKFMFDQHAETLAMGALSRILATPNEPFSDPARAGYYGAKFDAKVTSLQTSSVSGQQRAPMRTQPRWI